MIVQTEARTPETTEDPPLDPEYRIDLWLVAGCLLCGAFFFAPIGIGCLIYGWVLYRRAQSAGAITRPWAATVVGLFCMVDASMNFLGWGTDFFWAHDTVLGQTLWTGWGRLIDGGYYLFYNSRSMGGTAFSGEKAVEFASVVMVFPMRLVATWAFLRMRRWGLQYMIITSWMYAVIWLVWAMNFSMDIEIRAGSSLFGIIGIWFVGFCAYGPFLLLPYFLTVDARLWNGDRGRGKKGPGRRDG